jgi:hypothetical protein
MLHAVGYITFSNVTGQQYIEYQISETTGQASPLFVPGEANYLQFCGFGTAPNTNYFDFPMACQRVFYKPVAGPYNFSYCTARLGSFNPQASVTNLSLTATYFPTSYGTVSTVAGAQGNDAARRIPGGVPSGPAPSPRCGHPMRHSPAYAFVLMLVSSLFVSPFTSLASSTVDETCSAPAEPGQRAAATCSSAPWDRRRSVRVRGRDGSPRRVLVLGRGASVSVENPDLPIELAFASPAPNPAGGAVRLAIALPVARHVELIVFDAAGRRIKVLTNQRLDAGRHDWTWDLRDDAGERVGAGIYFSRLVVNSEVVGSRRIVIVH